MSSAPTIVAALRAHIDSNRPQAEQILAGCDWHDLYLIANSAIVLLAQAVTIMCDNDRAAVDDMLAGMGLIAAEVT